MIKLIGMDFDGTLLNDSKEVTKKTKDTLRAAREKNIKIVGVTARTLESAKNVVDTSLFDYLILNNGAFIVDENNKVIEKKVLEENDIFKITDMLKDKADQIDYCTETKYFIYKGNPNTSLSFIKSIDSYKEINEEICRINVFINKEIIDEELSNLQNKFKNLHTFIMQDSNDTKRWIVINPANLNKANSLEKLGNKLDIALDEMVFFGDGLNDLEAIERVGDGVAMGNALQIIKDKAKHVTLSNNDDGIASYILKNIL